MDGCRRKSRGWASIRGRSVRNARRCQPRACDFRSTARVSEAVKPWRPIAPQKTRTTLPDAIAKRFFHKRDTAKHDYCEYWLMRHTALTANAAAAIVPHWEEAACTASG